METKVCTNCKRELPATLEYFHKLKEGKLGLHSRCKECKNKIGREVYLNPAKSTGIKYEPELTKQYIPNLEIEVGMTYKLDIPKRGKGTEERKFFAKAIEDYNNFVVFQTKHYKESFQKVDLAKFKIKEA